MQIRGYYPNEHELLLHVRRPCSNLQSFVFKAEDSTEVDIQCWGNIVTTTAAGKAGGGTMRELGVDISTNHTLAEPRIPPMLFQESSRGLRRLKIHVNGSGYLKGCWTPELMAMFNNQHRKVVLGTNEDEESDAGA